MASVAASSTLRHLLAAPALRLRLVSGDAAALDRPIRWVHSTELSEPGTYLRGGELVCTVGVSLLDDAGCARFVRSVAAARAVGVCFGTGDVHPQVPPALAQACADNGVPLLELPAGAPFLALSEHLADQWVSAGSASSWQGEQLVGGLLGLLGAGASVAEILTAAGEATGGRLELQDPGSGRLRWTGAGEPPSADLLTQLGRVLQVAVREGQAARRTRLRELGTLLGLVADGVADARAVQPALDEAGLGDQPLLVVTAQPVAPDLPAAPARLGTLAGTTGDVLLVVTAPGPAAPADGPRGVSSVVPVGALGRALVEARAALLQAAATGRTVGPADLSTLDALLSRTSDDVLAPFVDQLVGPLADADHRHGTSQLQTLQLFLANDGSLQRTARQQFLHVNTVRHRLERVHQVTGRDPFRFTDRVAFAIALWAYLDRSGRPHLSAVPRGTS